MVINSMHGAWGDKSQALSVISRSFATRGKNMKGLRRNIQRWIQGGIVGILVLVLSFGLTGCGDRPDRESETTGMAPPPIDIEEVAPPEGIQAIQPAFDDKQPNVTILSPTPDQVIQNTAVSVQFDVSGLTLFKNEALGLGPHLHVFLDDQPYQAVYDPSQPLVFSDLTPGTHTIRAFASRPWHESFKNEDAYAQVSFHVYSKTPRNAVKSDLPLLTYSRPQGSYGAEPVMVDFYLTNTPTHFFAQDNPLDDTPDWKIRCTINGGSFILDEWKPFYLTGLAPGLNWLQLELLDEQDQVIPNAFNGVTRLITYTPDGDDALAKLIRGDVPEIELPGLADPNYVAPVVTEPEDTEPENLVEEPTAIEEPTEPEISDTEAAELDQEETTQEDEDAAGEESQASEEPIVEIDQTLTESESSDLEADTESTMPESVTAPDMPQNALEQSNPAEETGAIAPENTSDTPEPIEDSEDLSNADNSDSNPSEPPNLNLDETSEESELPATDLPIEDVSEGTILQSDHDLG